MQDRIYFLSDEGTLKLNGDDYGASGAGSNEIPIEIKTRSEGEPFVLDFTGGRIQKYTMDSSPSMNDPYLFFSIVDSDLSGVTQTIEVHVPIGSLEDDYNGEELPYMFPSSCILSQDKKFDFSYGSYDDESMLEVKYYNVFIAKATRDENGDWKHYVNLDHSYPDAKPIEVDYLSFTPHGNEQVKLQFLQHRYVDEDKGPASWLFGSGSSDYDFDLSYSFDKVNWTTYSYSIASGVEEAETITLNPGETVYLRGNNDRFYALGQYDYYYVPFYMYFSISGACNAGGNVSTLLKKSGKVTSLSDHAFYYLFRDCEDLVTPPKLPEVADGGLAESAYEGMFSGSGIRVAPQIPAVRIKDLEDPDLEFETVNGSSLKYIDTCFGWMFENCFNLEIPPSSLSLGAACYDVCSHMFYNCEKLKKTPEMTIPMTLSPAAFQGMFEGCTSLTDSYVKFSMDVDSDTFKFMLYNHSYSSLSYKSSSYYCKNFQGSYGLQFNKMFAGCSNLSAWHYPMKPGPFKVDNDEYSGFLSYLYSISAGNKDLTPFDSMFDGCWSLKDISFLDLSMVPLYLETPDEPLDSFDKFPRGYFVNMFKNCGVEEIPSSLCLTNPNALISIDSSTSAMFNWAEETIGGISFPHGICSGMFSGCSALVHVPSTLFAPADSQWHFLACSGSFAEMFEGCTSLEDQIYLPFVKTKQNSYADMFKRMLQSCLERHQSWIH